MSRCFYWHRPRICDARKDEVFHKHYGSSPLVLANIWYDLALTDITEARLNENEKSEKGFFKFLVANHFLWAYSKNSDLIASCFNICKRNSRNGSVLMAGYRPRGDDDNGFQSEAIHESKATKAAGLIQCSLGFTGLCIIKSGQIYGQDR